MNTRTEPDIYERSNLTRNQLLIWLGQKLKPEEPIYKVTVTFTFGGRVDRRRFQEAFQTLVNSSDSLRTVIEEIDGVPRQRVLEPFAYEVEYEDLAARPNQEDALKRWLANRRDIVFDLDRRLFDAALLKVAEERFVWVLSLHHIVTDGWSIALLYQRAADFYERAVNGSLERVARLPCFQDYVAHERAERASARHRRAREYWEKKVASKPAALFGGASGRTGATLRVSRRLGAERTQRLKTFAREEIPGATEHAALFHVFAAVLFAYLHRVTGRRRLSIGVPFHNRRGDFKATLGLVMGVSPLEIALDDDTIRSVVQKVRAEVAEIRPVRDFALANPAHDKLYDVVLNYHATNFPKFAGMPVHMQWIHTGRESDALALQVHDFDGSGELFLDFDFHSDVFNSDRRQRTVKQFFRLLDAVLADPSKQLKRIDLLASEERRRVLVEWNSTKKTYPADLCLHELFEAQVARTPDATAAVFEDDRATYRELNARANQLARRLQKSGVAAGALAAIFMERSLGMLIAVLGVLKAGAAYVPLDPAWPRERLDFILRDANASTVIACGRHSDSTFKNGPRIVRLDADRNSIAGESEENLPASVTLEDLAYVIYTSGSTGMPKGVLIEHRQILNYVHAVSERLDLKSGASFAMVQPLSVDSSQTVIFPALISGGCLHVISEERAVDARSLSDYFSRHPIDLLKIAPSHLAALSASTRAGDLLPRRWLIVGGEAARRDWLAELQAAASCAVFNHYGPTETTVGTLTHAVGHRRRVRGSATVPLGRPLANTRAYILDSGLEPVSIGETGELHISGAGLARGYLNRPALTAESFVPDPFSDKPGARLYKTGDLARYLSDGNIEFLGRLDDQIKIRGFRVEPGEIEAALCRHPAVREAAVLAREAAGETRLAAYVVCGCAAPGISELRAFLKTRLPVYMIPGDFIFLDALPRTLHGKLDRQALPAPVEFERGAGFIEPRDEIERTLANIWSQVLRVERVGVEDNFFELGGHSLLAIQIISRVRSAFHVELALRALFEAPTVAGMAGIIEAGRQTAGRASAESIQPVPRDGSLPLSFAQQRLWFVDQLAPGNSAYNIPAAFRIAGSLDAAALERSLDEIVDRHEVLRTTFAAVDGVPAQVIAGKRSFKMRTTDLSQMPAVEREAEIRRLLREEVARPFDLSADLMLRAALLKLGPEEEILILVTHHIASDGWSMGVLLRELAALYEAFSAGRPSPLAPLPIQYADFAVWQRCWLQGEVLERQLSFWTRQLQGAPRALELVTDRLRPAVQSYRGAAQSFALPKALSDEIKALSHRQGATLFMTLLASFSALLGRLTDRNDIVVGIDVANRNRIETEDLIGFFVNLLPIRADLSGNPAFTALLKRIRDVAMNAYAHQDLPFDKLVEELKPERDMSRHPLVQAVFVLQNLPARAPQISGLALSPLEVGRETAKFDLTLFTEEKEQGLVATWVYNSDLFDDSTIARLASRFETLLSGIVARPDAPLKALGAASEAERSRRAAAEKTRHESNLDRFRKIMPKAIDLSRLSLVETDDLAPGKTLPLLVRPALDDVDIVEWAKRNTEFIEGRLLERGALLFRGFGVSSVSQFENFASAICAELFGEYEDLPRVGRAGKVYESTPYPPEESILFHNESSHMHRWPMKQWFFCVEAARRGGETPLADCRKVYRLIDREILRRFAEKKIMYVRNFSDQRPPGWQEFFKTTDKSAVESYCRAAGMDFAWRANHGLRIRHVSSAAQKHPKTGEMVWFNQLQHWHLACLPLATRESLTALFAAEDLPRNCGYGDGSPIEDSAMEEIGAAYRRAAASFPWQPGDILMVDNMLTAHARNPFEGPRRIVVAMAEMIGKRDAADGISAR
jgi:amino acid adenylation domain-containing protein